MHAFGPSLIARQEYNRVSLRSLFPLKLISISEIFWMSSKLNWAVIIPEALLPEVHLPASNGLE